jgi:hypothetical protein
MREFLLTNLKKNGQIILIGHHEEYKLLRVDGSLEDLVRLGADEKGQIQYARKGSIEARIQELREKAA